uniref:Uncharacterized protein n=1 Tax=Calcidiscus leptoporus TaxID=127549 RepID=A0A7S0JHI7_9EUKA|mmetsp:Transcript_59191/g.135782  ORF Transcript_59191/g.135782 Transcript_59191/m.135782 type:complete len:433 (+) Transcript_59191:101-1399(+)
MAITVIASLSCIASFLHTTGDHVRNWDNGGGGAAALRSLRTLLTANNREHSIKTAPLTPLANFTGFHNHIAHQLVAMYRLGANATALQRQYAVAGRAYGPPLPSRGRVNITNWERQIGECGCGLLSGRTDEEYSDYVSFYAAQVEQRGVNATLLAYWPRLAAGLVGDIFHAVIQLGYAFEGTGRGSTAPAGSSILLEELVAQGLAWSSAAYATLPMPTAGYRSAAPLVVLQALHDDPHPFPHYTGEDEGTCYPHGDDPHGNVCFNDAVEDLIANHSAVLMRYELAPSSLRPADAFAQLCRAALVVFAAGGYNDFYLLHLMTGSRAVWALATLSGLPWAEITLHDMLRALWRAMLYVYVVKRRPSIAPAPVLTPPWRPWRSLQAAALLFPEEPHLAKLVLTCADFHARWNDDLYWQTAERAVALFEAGGKFEH